MATVIVGGGIIGLSTAYYLTRQETPQSVHIVDLASELLLSASGFAGGFLAKDWFSPDVAELGELSFRLRRELADENDGYRKWGYAPSTAYSLAIDRSYMVKRKTRKHDRNANWLTEKSSRAEVAPSPDDKEVYTHNSGDGAGRHEILNSDGSPAWATQQDSGTLDVISSKDGSAQVEPRELCEWLREQCTSKGVKITLACHPLKIDKDEMGKIRGLLVKQEYGRANYPLLELGLERWSMDTNPLAGYSVVVRSPRHRHPIVEPGYHDKQRTTGMCHSIFCAPGPNWSYAPEAISRTTRAGRPEVYVAGLNDESLRLPASAGDVKGLMDDVKLQNLYQTSVLLTGVPDEGNNITEDDLEVVRRGLCFRPVSSNGQPIVTKLPAKQIGKDIANEHEFRVFIAAGHGPWGISLGPGTGFVVAQMVQDQKISIDISRLGV